MAEDEKTTGRELDGRFKKGHKALAGGGRPKGRQAHLTVAMKDAIITAAELCGRKQFDKKTGAYTRDGPDGLVGYMQHLARHNEQVFGTLLNKVLPMHITSAAVQNRVYRTEAEVRQLCAERGVPFERVMALAEPVPIDMIDATTDYDVTTDYEPEKQ
jgi:hypothetical protein